MICEPTDNVRHDRLLEKVAQRVDDKDIMHLLKLMLKASGSALGVLWGFAGAVQPAGYSIETGRTRR